MKKKGKTLSKKTKVVAQRVASLPENFVEEFVQDTDVKKPLVRPSSFLIFGLVFLAAIGIVFLAYTVVRHQAWQAFFNDSQADQSQQAALPGANQQLDADCLLFEKLNISDLMAIKEEDCARCLGKWELLSQELDLTGCNPRTSDGGKRCGDYQECVGSCLVEDASTSPGTCSSYKYQLGCHFELFANRAMMICRD